MESRNIKLHAWNGSKRKPSSFRWGLPVIPGVLRKSGGLPLRIFCAGGGSPTGKCAECLILLPPLTKLQNSSGPEVHCTQYVDDFTIFVSAATITHSTRIIHIAINNLEQWTKTKGMRFSIEKTVAIKFEKRKKGEEPQLTLHGSRVQVRESTRYLGLIIDKRLNWKDYVDHLRAKCTSC